MHMVFSLDESTFASVSGPFREIMYVCDSETGYCISGPYKLPGYGYVNDVCFSPDGKHILVKFATHAVVWDIETGEEQFQIQGVNYAFIHQGRRIASTHWMEEDGRSFQMIDLENFEESMVSDSSEDEGVSDGSEDEGVSDGSEDEGILDDFEDEDASEFEDYILVRVWDASNGTLISNRLLEVNDVAVTRFSPDGRFLAVGRKSENVIELWNLEDVRDPQRFVYPHGKLSFIRFSPTSDTLMAVFKKNLVIFTFGDWTHKRWYPSAMISTVRHMLFIHPSPITFLSHEITQWSYGMSLRLAQEWSGRRSLQPVQA